MRMKYEFRKDRQKSTIIFDCFVDDEKDNGFSVEQNPGYWTDICSDCLMKYEVALRNRVESAPGGAAICGVEGCRNDADYYVDFKRGEVCFMR